MTGAGNSTQGQRSSRPLSAAAPPSSNAANLVPGLNEPTSAFISEERRRRLGQETIAEGEDGEHPPTLIEGDIETLFAGFQKRRKSQQSEDGERDVEKDLEWQELEERSRKLNSNGRVDYSIQEGVSDDCSSITFSRPSNMVTGFRHLAAGQYSESYDVLG
jgi:hypothetical protein